VAIQEPKTKRMLHQYQLHKISYCADDKAEKRFFSFIAKEDGDSNRHTCFVFVSDKLAEEITLTIGQAFELAYKKFLDTSGKDLETKKQLLVLQKRVALLEGENSELKTRLREVADIKGRQDIADYMKKNNITEISEVRVHPVPTSSLQQQQPTSSEEQQQNGSVQEQKVKSALEELICLEPAATAGGEATAAKLDGFTLDDLNDDDFNPRAAAAGTSSSSDEDADDDFDPRAPQVPAPLAVVPPNLPPRDSAAKITAGGGNYQQNLSQPMIPIFPKDDPFAKNPFAGGGDPFGMVTFESSSSAAPPPLAAANILAAADFSLSPEFSLDELDPLKN
jgi:hypothetical protein